MRVGDVSKIQSGYTARQRLEPASHGGVAALQLRDVAKASVIDPASLIRADLTPPWDRYVARAGDVVFRSRGDRNTARAIGDAAVEPIVVVLPLMLLRPRREVILPEFLAWAINQRPAQLQLEASAYGTNIRMISRSALAGLDIAVPDLATQRRLVEADALADREQELAADIATKRRLLASAVLIARAEAGRPRELKKGRR